MLNFKTLSSCFLSSMLILSISFTFAIVGCQPSNTPKSGEGFVEITELFLKKYQGEYIQEPLGNLSLQKEVRVSDQTTQEKPQSIRDTYNIQIRHVLDSQSIDWKQVLSETSYLKDFFNLLPEDQKSFVLSQSAYVCLQKSGGRIYSILENFQKEFRSEKFPYLPSPELKEKVLALHQQKPERRYYMIIWETPEETEFFLAPSIVSKNMDIPSLRISHRENSQKFSDFLYYLKIRFCSQSVNTSKKDPLWEVLPIQTLTDNDGKNVLHLEIKPEDSQILFPKGRSENKLTDQEKSSQANPSQLKFSQIK